MSSISRKINNFTFFNIKSLVVTPIHFESDRLQDNTKAMELLVTDDKDNQFTVTVYGDLSGKNNMPEISFAPVNVVQLR